MKKIPIWMDSDAGIDDAIALMCALKTPELDIVGMSAVAGNVELEHTFPNIRNVLSLCGREDIPVYRGADRPMIQPLVTGKHVHGENGIADVELTPSKAPIEKEAAWDALYKKAKEMKGELTLVAVGPLTNIGILISKYPDFKDYIKQISIMGGALIGGNIRPAAEFNIFVDPHAAQIVFKSGIKIIMSGLDVTLKALIEKEEIEKLKDLKSPVGRLCDIGVARSLQFNETCGLPAYPPHDLNALWILSNPELYQTIVTNVYVETQSELTLGKTVTDYWNGDGKLPKNDITVVMDVDRLAFAKKFQETLEKYEAV